MESNSIESVQVKSSELSQKTETSIQQSLEHVVSQIGETDLDCNVNEQTGDQEEKLLVNAQCVQDDFDRGTTEQDDIYGSTTEVDDIYGSTTEPEDTCRDVTKQDELYEGTTEVDDCTENEKEECQEYQEVNSSAAEIKALIFFTSVLSLHFQYILDFIGGSFRVTLVVD